MKSKAKNSLLVGYSSGLIAALLIGLAPAALTYSVDPYELLRESTYDRGIKDRLEKGHYPLWKFAHYSKNAETIVLGDSRARSLRDKYWHEFGEESAYNFAYGGGTIPEIFDTFKQVRKNRKLKTLVVGIQLRSFDETHKDGMNRVPEAVRATSSSISYLKNWFVAKKSWDVLQELNPENINYLDNAVLNLISNANATELGAAGYTRVETLLLPEVCFGCELPEGGEIFYPTVTKGPNLGLGRGRRNQIERNNLFSLIRVLPKKFDSQVRKNARSDWKSFRFSNRYLSMLKEIAQWADASPERNLIFVIPPTIVEMQRTIAQFGLRELDVRLRRELAKLGDVVDFDFPNEITQDLVNFSDAYHFNSKLARLIVGEILLQKSPTPNQRARILKHRSALKCPSEKNALSPPRGTSFFGLEGSACRVWRHKENG